MTYSSGGLIEAVDYNTFATNLNAIWAAGTGDSGWGQTSISSVAALGVVTATNWATLVTNLSSSGSTTNTAITSRTNPTTGDLINILANVATDISSCTTNRGNAAASGSTVNSWTGSIAKTTATGAGQAGWTITWTQTVTFASDNAARYFFNAGGLIGILMSKTGNVTDIDPDWNTFVGQVGTLYFSGRVAGAAQTIAGTSYTGTTRIGGTGGTQTILSTTTGWYSLTAGAGPTILFQLANATSPYTGETIQVTAAKNAGSTAVTFVTTWTQPTVSGAGQTANISGGTDTASPFAAFGTAPAVYVRCIQPSTTYLSASWAPGSVAPAISSSVA
jgi:hypothetical protein